MTAPHPIVWIHGDDLSSRNAALLACPNAPAIFIFDNRALDRYGIGLKRIAFIYECLLELPVTIRRGDLVDELLAFATEHGADRIITTESPAPGFSAIVRGLESRLAVTMLQSEPFVPDLDYDLGRFSRYWRDAERFALQPNEEP
ncbi:MAG: hypothetical protein ACR2J8_13390 [Thermomicrobiales bacterium]